MILLGEMSSNIDDDAGAEASMSPGTPLLSPSPSRGLAMAEAPADDETPAKAEAAADDETAAADHATPAKDETPDASTAGAYEYKFDKKLG